MDKVTPLLDEAQNLIHQCGWVQGSDGTMNMGLCARGSLRKVLELTKRVDTISPKYDELGSLIWGDVSINDENILFNELLDRSYQLLYNVYVSENDEYLTTYPLSYEKISTYELNVVEINDSQMSSTEDVLDWFEKAKTLNNKRINNEDN